MRSERCRVVVKARPTLEDEVETINDVLTIPADGKVALNAQGRDREAKEFTVDGVYLPQQGDAVYHDEVRPLVSCMFQGFNATVFAYGASGSGKTYTVLGSRQAPGRQHAPGLVDCVIEDIFARYDERTCTVMVSIEELYKEQFTDLLAPADQHCKQPSVHFRTPQKPQPNSRRYKWQSKKVCSAQELREVMHTTLRKRHTAQTILNQKSSRSHVIVTLAVEQRIPVFHEKQAAVADGNDNRSGNSTPAGSVSVSSEASADFGQDPAAAAVAADNSSGDCSSSEAGSVAGVSTYLIGKLYLVDLAGSENIKRSGAEGEHQKEAGLINRSLCHLKTVIEEVFKGGKPPTYRNSKLTLKLKDALGGGNSKLLMIACISTARNNLPETKETLRFAEMARSITNTPTINREPKDELIERLRLEIEDLHDQLNKAAKGCSADEMLQQQINALEAAYAELQEQMEEKEAKWSEDAAASKQQLASISRELCSTAGREAKLQSQKEAGETIIQQLRHSLHHGQEQLQRTQAAQADAMAVLQAAMSEVLALGGECAQLQVQLQVQQAAADTARQLCADQQKQAQLLQSQLGEQAHTLKVVKQQLSDEQAARATAEQQGAQLQRDLLQETAAKAAADVIISKLQEQLYQEQSSRAAAEQYGIELQRQLGLETASRAAAELSITQLQEQLQHQIAQEAADKAAADFIINKLQQQLQQEAAARAAAEQLTLQLQEQLDQETASRIAAEVLNNALQEQLQQELTARAAAEQLSAKLSQQLNQEQADKAAAEKACSQFEQQLQQEVAAAAAAEQSLQQQVSTSKQQTAELRRQLQTQKQARQTAEAALTAVAASMTHVMQELSQIQQHLRKQQAKQAKASACCSSCVKDASSVHQQLVTECSHRQQLQQELLQLQAEQRAEREAAAEHAQMLGAQLEHERENWQRACQTARSNIAQLQQQLASEKAAHAAELAELKQRHAEQLNKALQSSVQKAVADKLRCREQLTLQLHDLRADANSLSEALNIDPVDRVLETPTSTRLVLHRSLADEAVQAELQQEEAAEPLPQQNSRYQHSGDGEEDDSSEGGEELSFAGGEAHSSDADSISEDTEVSDAEACDAAASECSDQSSSLLAGGRGEQQQARSGGNSSISHSTQQEFPARGITHMRISTGSSTGAAAMDVAAATASWPTSYLPDDQVDLAAAARVFTALDGGDLKVDNLVKFLRGRTLGGLPHCLSLPGGRRKIKMHLIQDMLAWHQQQQQQHGSAAATTSAAASMRSSSCSSAADTRTNATGSMDGAAECGRSETSSSSFACTSPHSKSSAGGSSSASAGGVVEIMDLRTPDTAKAAAVPDIADSSKGLKTPRGSMLSPSSAAAAAASSPAPSSSSIWGWLTPRGSKKKQKSMTAAAAAAAGTSPMMQPLGSHASSGLTATPDCDIALSPAAGADRSKRSAGPVAISEGIVSPRGGSSGLTAVQQFLLMEQQDDPELWARGAELPATAGHTAIDSRALQGGALSAYRSSWRHQQMKAASGKRR